MLNNNYTLITGASEGFGKALALECASRKMNLVLVALPGPEIFYLADFIKRNYKVDVVSIETDLSTFSYFGWVKVIVWAPFSEVSKVKLP